MDTKTHEHEHEHSHLNVPGYKNRDTKQGEVWPCGPEALSSLLLRCGACGGPRPLQNHPESRAPATTAKSQTKALPLKAMMGWWRVSTVASGSCARAKPPPEHHPSLSPSLHKTRFHCDWPVERAHRQAGHRQAGHRQAGHRQAGRLRFDPHLNCACACSRPIPYACVCFPSRLSSCTPPQPQRPPPGELNAS